MDILSLMPLLAMFIPELRDLLSSQLGGLFMGQMASADFQKQMTKFTEMVQTSNDQAMAMLRSVIGVSEPGVQIRPSAQLSDAVRAELQGAIDRGEEIPENLVKYTETAPAEFPSAIQGMFDVAQRGMEFAGEQFDPEAAVRRYNESFESVTRAYQALPGEIAAGNVRVEDVLNRAAGAFQADTQNVMNLWGQGRDEFEQGAGAIMDRWGGLRGEFRAGAAGIERGYEDILGRAREEVSTLGEAERQDINRRWTETGIEAEMGLKARGLGGGSIQSSMAAGVERERSTALLGLEEQTARQRLGVEEVFGLGGLSAQERLLGAGINLDIGAAGTAERLLGQETNLQMARIGSAERQALAKYQGGFQQAGAMQFGNQLYATTAMGSLGALGNIAGGQFGARNEAAMNFLNSLGIFGTMGPQAQMQGMGMYLPWQGGQTFIQPQPAQGPTIW